MGCRGQMPHQAADNCTSNLLSVASERERGAGSRARRQRWQTLGTGCTGGPSPGAPLGNRKAWAPYRRGNRATMYSSGKRDTKTGSGSRTCAKSSFGATATPPNRIVLMSLPCAPIERTLVEPLPLGAGTCEKRCRFGGVSRALCRLQSAIKWRGDWAPLA